MSFEKGSRAVGEDSTTLQQQQQGDNGINEELSEGEDVLGDLPAKYSPRQRQSSRGTHTMSSLTWVTTQAMVHNPGHGSQFKPWFITQAMVHIAENL